MDPSEIRPPDSVTNEQLIADNRSEFDKQMEEYMMARTNGMPMPPARQ